MVPWVCLKNHHLIKALSASRKPSPKPLNAAQPRSSVAVIQSLPSHAQVSRIRSHTSPPVAAPRSSFSLATNSRVLPPSLIDLRRLSTPYLTDRRRLYAKVGIPDD